ncbi:MAG: hypothetical protein R3C68_00745 [Myxococcota bacterium]
MPVNLDGVRELRRVANEFQQSVITMDEDDDAGKSRAKIDESRAVDIGTSEEPTPKGSAHEEVPGTFPASQPTSKKS